MTKVVITTLLMTLAPSFLHADQAPSLPNDQTTAVRLADGNRGGIKWLIVGMLAAQAADIATTSLALQRGCSERTYYGLQNKWAIGAMKGGGALALTVTLPFAHNKKPKLTKALLWGQIASGAIGATINSTRLPHC
jgi:hypothetical protein